MSQVSRLSRPWVPTNGGQIRFFPSFLPLMNFEVDFLVSNVLSVPIRANPWPIFPNPTKLHDPQTVA
jgi:hypothetical protein